MCNKVISKSWQHLNLTIFSINLLTLNTQPAFSDQPTALDSGLRGSVQETFRHVKEQSCRIGEFLQLFLRGPRTTELMKPSTRSLT
jgi:hypothetical protein